MLQAGVMEAGNFSPSYSGTPQGGIASPILANIVLHELDIWLEEQYKVNPLPQTPAERNARSNPEYMRLHYRIMDIQRYLDGKRPMPRNTNPEELRRELQEKRRLRSLQPRLLPRKVTYYCRYADDFLVILCDASKKEVTRRPSTLCHPFAGSRGQSPHYPKLSGTCLSHHHRPVHPLDFHHRSADPPYDR